MILVDSAIWPWRGRRWAHMVSDAGYGELHRFAGGLGLARVSFQGDHYDVDEALRLSALDAGAEAVDARELLRRLRAAGLRRPPGGRPWRWQVVAEWPLRALPESIPWPPGAEALLEAGAEALARRWDAMKGPGTYALRVMSRPGERAVVVVDGGGVPARPLAELVVEVGDEDGAPEVPQVRWEA